MANTHIVTEKELNYIETLYTYCNLQDFVSHTTQQLYREESEKKYELLVEELGGIHKYQEAVLMSTAEECYKYMLQYVADTLLGSCKFLGTSKGRDWYDLGYCRLGIMDYHVARKANQFNVSIQYSQSHMFSLGSGLKGLKLPFDGELSQYFIHRIDLTKIVKTDKDYLTNHSFISPYRSIARFGNDTSTETVYLGKRDSGNVFRMYNKSIELQVDNKEHPIDFKKIELFSKYFGDIENLYTFELELHRKYLKPNFGIDSLSDIVKVYDVYREIVGKIKIYEDTDDNKRLISQKHHDRIDTYIFCDYVECKRIQKKKYETSEKYLVNKIASLVQRYEDSLSEKLEDWQRLVLLDKILSSVLKGHDVSIELEDDEPTEDYNHLVGRIELMRDGQDDTLYREANFAFAPIFSQKADDVF